MTEAHGAVTFLYLSLSYKAVDHERGLVRTQVSTGFFLHAARVQYRGGSQRELRDPSHLGKISDYRGQWSIKNGSTKYSGLGNVKNERRFRTQVGVHIGGRGPQERVSSQMAPAAL